MIADKIGYPELINFCTEKSLDIIFYGHKDGSTILVNYYRNRTILYKEEKVLSLVYFLEILKEKYEEWLEKKLLRKIKRDQKKYVTH